MKLISRLFFMIFLIIPTSVVLSAEQVSSPNQLKDRDVWEQISAATAVGNLSESEALYQRHAWLFSQPDLQRERFQIPGVEGVTFDCSATVLQLDYARLIEEERFSDPYGLLWKSWLDEAERIRRQGALKKLGPMGDVPVQLLYPRGYWSEDIKYARVATSLSRFTKRYSKLSQQLAKQAFGKTQIRVWEDLLWPPHFLRSQVPYVRSYFDEHPVFNASTSKRWGKLLNRFFKRAAVFMDEEEAAQASDPAWTWVLSDQVKRNALIWDPKGRSILFLSMPCFDRILQHQWKDESQWDAVLYEMVLHEVLSAYYLNARPSSVLEDPYLDASIQGLQQVLLPDLSPLFLKGPFFQNQGAWSLSSKFDSGQARYATAPLWYFLTKTLGPKALRRHFKKPEKTVEFLVDVLQEEVADQELAPAFLVWALGWTGVPSSLQMNVPRLPPGSPAWPSQTDIELGPIQPPRGVIGASHDAIEPQSIRFFHTRIEDQQSLAALNLRWEPRQKNVRAYLFIKGEVEAGKEQFLDYATIKPAVTQRVWLDPFRLPTELYFVVLNLGEKRIPPQALQLQISVVPWVEESLSEL